jgi:hypothetical protein
MTSDLVIEPFVSRQAQQIEPFQLNVSIFHYDIFFMTFKELKRNAESVSSPLHIFLFLSSLPFSISLFACYLFHDCFLFGSQRFDGNFAFLFLSPELL